MKYSPFGTFSEFPAIFGNSQDESKFLILEWRRTYWWLLKNPPPSPPPLKTLKRQICEEEEDMVGKEMGRWWILDQNLSLTLRCFCKASLPPPYFHSFNPPKFIPISSPNCFEIVLKSNWISLQQPRKFSFVCWFMIHKCAPIQYTIYIHIHLQWSSKVGPF